MDLFRVMTLVSHELEFKVVTNGKVENIVLNKKGTSVLTEEITDKIKILEDSGAVTVIHVRSSSPIDVTAESVRSTKLESTTTENEVSTEAESDSTETTEVSETSSSESSTVTEPEVTSTKPRRSRKKE